MEQQIAKYRKVYKIFVILMLIGFIDGIIIPTFVSSVGNDLGDVGFIPRGLAFIAGKTGGMVGLWFDGLWFIFGLVAVIYNRLANRLQKKITQETKV